MFNLIVFVVVFVVVLVLLNSGVDCWSASRSNGGRIFAILSKRASGGRVRHRIRDGRTQKPQPSVVFKLLFV